MNILITSAGRRVSLINAFKTEIVRFFPDGKIFTADMIPELSSACRVSDGFFSVIRVTEPEYCKNLIKLCLANNVKIIIPTIDTELIPLAENYDQFMDNGIIPLISPIDTILICRDKRKLFQFFDSIDFPRTTEIDPVSPDFPIFVKPIDGSSSIGARILTNMTQLHELDSEKERMLFLRYLCPHDYAEYTIDMYFDKNGSLKCAVPRERIEIRSGEVSKSVTRKSDIYEKILQISSGLKGFVGCITLQVFQHMVSREIIGIEINPRFGGGYPLSYLAGANFPEFIIREYFMNETIPFYDNWKNDLLMLRYDAEIIIDAYKG